MALKKAITKYGQEFPDSYHRIGSIRIEYPESVRIRIDTFVSQEAAENGEQHIDSVTMYTTLEACNATKANMSLEKAYAVIKKAEFFTDADDV